MAKEKTSTAEDFKNPQEVINKEVKMSNKIDTFYDKLSPALLYKIYQTTPNIMRKATKLLVNGLKDCNTVLDVGVGPGMIATSMLKQGKSVYGLDLRKSMVQHADYLAKSQGLSNFSPMQGDARQIKLPDESIDGAYIANNITHFDGFLDEVIGEIFRVLSPGGILAVTGYEQKMAKRHRSMVERESLDTVTSGAVKFTKDELKSINTYSKKVDFTDIKDSLSIAREALEKRFTILQEVPHFLDDTCYFLLAQKVASA